MFKLFSLGVVFDAITLVITGLVVKVLWGWFVVTAFGLTAITLSQALGVVLLVSILTHQYVPKKGATIEVLTEVWVDNTVYPIVLFILGWIIHLLA